jgi:hypothetical protein
MSEATAPALVGLLIIGLYVLMPMAARRLKGSAAAAQAHRAGDGVIAVLIWAGGLAIEAAVLAGVAGLLYIGIRAL